MPWDSLDTYNVNSVLKTSKKEKNERNHAHGQRKKEYSSEIEQQVPSTSSQSSQVLFKSFNSWIEQLAWQILIRLQLKTVLQLQNVYFLIIFNSHNINHEHYGF